MYIIAIEVRGVRQAVSMQVPVKFVIYMNAFVLVYRGLQIAC
nr:MAG TPA: hypothetical protein [Caudoviricetes sp.]